MPASPDSTSPDGPLLGTKFHIPGMRRGQVSRSRLVDRLERGSGGKLTILSAPPGFGKTTLLAEWIASSRALGRTVAWVSLDEADNHHASFWKYVLGALAIACPSVERCGALELLDAQQPPYEHLLTLVLNAIASEPDDVWLMLDDYHLIEAEGIQRAMSFLVEHLPPQLHLVLAGRVDPELPLARLRARGELTEVRAADLRLTLEETDAFLNGLMGLELAEADVARLEARTEGWAGALQLAALSLRGREEASEFISSFSGDDRYIVDYLVEEVVQRQDAPVRDFLLRTSILERLSGPLCDAVTGGTDGRRMLETLERSNLFVVPLDDQRRWFRYHQLFSDVLQAQLAEQLPGEVAELHTRASDWYAANGEPDRAIRHALSARDFARAAAVIELEAETIQRHHHPERLLEWLKPIPDSVVRQMPVLSTFYGHALQGMGQLEASAARLDDAARIMAESPSEAVVYDQRAFSLLPALIAVGQGFLSMAARNGTATVTYATEALALLPRTEYHWRGTAVALLGLAHWIEGDLALAEQFHAEAVASFEQSGEDGLAITSAYHQAELLKALGRLNDAQRRLESSLRFIMQRGGAAARGAANLNLGLSELFCDRNDLAGAARELENADQLGVFPPRTPFRRCLAQARLSQCRGDLEGAAELLDEAEQLYIRGAVPDYRPVAAWRARVRVAQGRVAEALAWARERGLSADDELHYLREYEHITLARILLASAQAGDAAKGRELLQRLLEAAERAGRTGTAIELRVLLACAMEAASETSLALEALEPALLRAAPEGYVRLFIDAGEPMAVLLRQAAERGVVPEYCRRLLGAMVDLPAPAPVQAVGQDALSERELDVLRLLASELSGPDIATQLFVSLNTLRTHTKNIYAKLGVNTRRAAVRRATELGLI